MAHLVPGPFLTWFLTQPEVTFHIFGWLRHSEKMILSAYFSMFKSALPVDSIKQIKKICRIHFNTWPKKKTKFAHVDSSYSLIFGIFFFVTFSLQAVLV